MIYLKNLLYLYDMDKVLSEFEALSKDIGLTENDIDWAKAREIVAEYVSEANNAEAEVKSQGIKAIFICFFAKSVVSSL